MKVVILAGGFGTRLSEMTGSIPKPMIEIGGRPILWHIMHIYAHYGFSEFIIALGFKSEIIKEYFLNYYAKSSDLTINLSNGQTIIHERQNIDWKIHLVDTGLHTKTGGRLKRLKDWLGDEAFLMTYGDGVSDVNIAQLVSFHQLHGKLATLTAVHPPARFGGLVLNDNQVMEFSEKNQSMEGWINGGFFVLEPKVLEYIADDETFWEKQPLENLAQDGQLSAFFHKGFWQPMDTLRECRLLQEMWDSGNAPWKVWDMMHV